jgi:hypothetical protein
MVRGVNLLGFDHSYTLQEYDKVRSLVAVKKPSEISNFLEPTRRLTFYAALVVYPGVIASARVQANGLPITLLG